MKNFGNLTQINGAIDYELGPKPEKNWTDAYFLI
jgi:hypothetical protein